MTTPTKREPLKVLHVISGDLWAGAEAQAATLLKHLKPLCDVSAVLMNEGELANRLRSNSINVTVFDESKLSTLQIFLRLRAHLKNTKPDVVHTHRQKENIIGGIANAISTRARCVRTVHGASEFAGNWKSNLQRKIDELVGNYLQHAIIAVSDELKDKLEGTYKSNKLHAVTNGVDVDELKAKAGIADFKKAEPHKKHIGIIGRLVPVKRVDVFLQTAALFKQANLTDYHFHVIGDGPLRADIEQQARALNLTGSIDAENWITFHGQRNDIPSYINSLDAVVMCSDHEGMPMVALETLALGAELIATKNLSFADQLKSNAQRPEQTSQGVFRALTHIRKGRNPEDNIISARTSAKYTYEIYKFI